MSKKCDGCKRINACPNLKGCPCPKCVVKVLCSEECEQFLDLRNHYWNVQFSEFLRSNIELKGSKPSWTVIDEFKDFQESDKK